MQNQKVHDLYDAIKKHLTDVGVSYWKAVEVLQSIDAFAYMSVIEDTVDNLSSEKNLELFTLLKTGATDQQIAQVVGLDSSKLKELHIKKLEECLADLPNFLAGRTDKK